MQFRLYFSFPGQLSLPLGYNHILQGFIYETLRAEPENSAFLHDHGYIDENRPFKLFVFSQIDGKYEVKAPKIFFNESISFEIRSPMSDFCDIFYLALMHREQYILNGQEVFLTGCVATKRTITSDDIKVRTLSPIALTKTCMDEDSKKTIYISPDDEEYETSVISNFVNKYRAAYGNGPEPGLRICPVNVTGKDKVVTKFGGKIYVTAWNGIYRLTGDPHYLQFLYDCGVGAKNSQGFGMVEMV